MRSMRLLSRHNVSWQTPLRASHRPFPPSRLSSCATCEFRRFKTNNATSAPEAARPRSKLAVQYPVPAEAKSFSEQANELAKGFGFLFDCDGVLYQGGQQIQSAGPALRLCRSHDAGYLFLTNGGGNTNEQEKAASLHKKMGIPKDEDLINGRVIQSHTPLSEMFSDEDKEQKTVYTTSLDPDKAREIIEGYGFKNVVTATDLLAQYEHIFPFEPKQIGNATAKPLPGNAKLWNAADKECLKIDHIFVLNDPRDWALETQIIYDLLISRQGYYGTVSSRHGHPGDRRHWAQKDGQPKLWISNLDMFWKTEHPMNRFGTGGFFHAFKGVWRGATGQILNYHYLGKPGSTTYQYAHKTLLKPTGQDTAQKSLRRVYMVGDNPESDVRGALDFKPADGTEYVPILVKTGVWQETKGESKPRWEPAVIVDDVLDAVVWAMRQEGIYIDRQTAIDKLSSG